MKEGDTGTGLQGGNSPCYHVRAGTGDYGGRPCGMYRASSHAADAPGGALFRVRVNRYYYFYFIYFLFV